MPLPSVFGCRLDLAILLPAWHSGCLVLADGCLVSKTDQSYKFRSLCKVVFPLQLIGILWTGAASEVPRGTL